VKFEYIEQVTHDFERVFVALRDRLTEVPAFMPELDRIDELEREERKGGRLHIVNEWHGNSKSAPPAVRPFVTKSMTTWRDYALWDNDRRLVEWRFETNHFESLYECAGTNYIEDDGAGGTRIRLTGDLLVYPERVPGVPKLLARRLRPKVESFLMSMVTPNLALLPKAVQALLDGEREPSR